MEDDEKQLFAQRLNYLCDIKGVPPKARGRQVTLGKIFGISQKGVRKWLEGEGLPSTELAIKIAIWGGVQFEWLMTGRGSKLAAEERIGRIPEIGAKLIAQMGEATQHDAIKILNVLAQHKKDGTNDR